MPNNWSVDWKVELGGQDLTARWRPLLISIMVNDLAGSASDSCELRLDDSHGQLRFPAKRMPLKVSLNGAAIFGGFVEKARSSGSRSSGRLLTVSAKAMDSGSRVKEPQRFHLDDATLGDFLGKMAAQSGITLQVDEELSAYRQDYWAADGESFISMAQRLAQKFGGTFKIRGERAILALRGAAASPGGSSLGVTDAVFGRNLLDWDISPREPRRQFGTGQARWFDRSSATYKAADLDFGGDTEVVNVLRPVLGGKDEASATLAGRKRENKWEGGEGNVTLNVEPSAVVEGVCRVSGARQGIDGNYSIASVKHSADRDGGAKTVLELKQPGDGASVDDRAPA